LKPGDLFRRFGRSLGEVNFRRYLIGRILMTLGAGGAAFYAVHFQSEAGGGVPEPTVIKLSSLLMVGQCLVSYPLGRLGDRMGHKVGIVLGAFGQVAAIAVAFLGRGPMACGAAFILCGVAWAAAWVSHINMLFETCPHDSRVAHITLSNMVLGPVLALVPMGTGWLVEAVSVRTGIGLTLVPTLLGVLWLALMVREPRHVELDRRSGPDDLKPLPE
jgi:MFS family permease